MLGTDLAREAHAAVVVDELRRAAASPLIVLDFAEIAAVTSAFVRRALVDAIRVWAPTDGPALSVMNITGEAAAGVFDVLVPERVTLFEALRLGAGEPAIVRGRLVGAELDKSLRETLDIVVAAAGRVTAPQLQLNDPHRRTPTAWNNRLNDLAARGLIRREQSGRRWSYWAYVKEIV